MVLTFDIKTEQGKRDFQLFCEACKKMLTGEGYQPQSFNTCECRDTCVDPCERGCPIAVVLSPGMARDLGREQLQKVSEVKCIFEPCSKECREFACAVCPTFRDCADIRKWAKVDKH